MPKYDLIFGCLFCAALFYSQLEAKRVKQCSFRGVKYDEGEEFEYQVKANCTYDCICSIQGQRAFRNCTRRCPLFTYPPGCRIIRDRCGCAARYVCPEPKCTVRGMRYSDGEEFEYNGQNNCTRDCVCNIQGRVAYRNCTRRCPLFTYPPGCRIIRDRCGCAATYVCPEPKCYARGVRYADGVEFEYNDQNNCTHDCECNVRGRAALKNCVRRCAPFTYPSGCQVTRDQCGCGVSYQCRNVACNVRGVRYAEGEHFQHEIRPNCIYNCTCLIRGQRAYGNCSRRCATLTFPPGCEPVRDACGCASSYDCPNGERCEDPQTGLLYRVGRKWTNDTCECTCFGELRGAYQCKCARPLMLSHVTEADRDDLVENPCRANETVTCHSCQNPESNFTAEYGMNMSQCSDRRKCETWPYVHTKYGEVMNMTCTCYGPNSFTQCVSAPVRRKRWIPFARDQISFIMGSIANTEGQPLGAVATELVSLNKN